MIITQLVHVNLVVADVERSVDFYTNVLGARIVRDWWGESETTGEVLGFGKRTIKWHAYMLRWGKGNDATFPQIDLLEWIEPKSIGAPYRHMNNIGIPRICVETPDVDAMYEELRDKGVEFLSPPRLANPRTKRGSKTKVCCLRDPDGIVIELIGPLGS